VTEEGASPLILCVNDDPATTYLWRRLLSRAGHRVLEASTGKEALALARTHHPDLALLDIRLPDMLGFDVCRALKGDPQTADVLVLQSSAAMDSSGMKVEGLDSGADAYLAQPFESEELLATVRALLRTREAERRIQRARDLWHLTFDAMADGIALLDAEGRVERANRALSDLVGRPSSELRGVPSSTLAAWLGLQPALFDQVLAQEGSQAAQDIDLQGRWYQARLERLGGMANDQAVLLLVVSDCHDSRMLVLAQERRAEALAEVDRRKDEFLAMLAHELRNPLSAIAMALHLLERSDPQSREQARSIVSRQMDHLVRLVNDLLDLSRLNHGRIELRLETVDLRDLIQNAAGAVLEMTRSTGHQLELDPGPEPLLAQVDPLRIEQVLANLLHNALKYSPAGTRVELLARREGDRVRVSVTDQGAGIAPEALEHVFDLFFQTDRTLARSKGGLGIGLTLVRRLVEQHGGTVTAHSDGPDLGARFELTLPLQESAPLEDPDTLAPREELPLRCLVVEDNPDAREMLSEVLRVWGHEVETAPDGLVGLDKLLELRPDLALVDIGLPGIDGYQVAANARARPELNGTFLVAVTGYGRPEDRSRALDAGFDTWIVKPLDLHMLQRLLSKRAEIKHKG
jgi:signal transduction histidine kinase